MYLLLGLRSSIYLKMLKAFQNAMGAAKLLVQVNGFFSEASCSQMYVVTNICSKVVSGLLLTFSVHSDIVRLSDR